MPSDPSAREKETVVSSAPGRSLRLAIATMGGVGSIPFASGTFGTLATVPVYLLLSWPRSAGLYTCGTVLAVVISIWACDACEARYGVKDPAEAVADEMSGFLVTMAFIPFSIAGLAGGFFLFRLTDVLKPFPARQLERLPGGWGIVADDLAAALWANLLLRLALFAWRSWGS